MRHVVVVLPESTTENPLRLLEHGKRLTKLILFEVEAGNVADGFCHIHMVIAQSAPTVLEGLLLHLERLVKPTLLLVDLNY